MPESASKHPLEDDYKAMMKRALEAEAKLEEANKSKERAQSEASALRRKQGITVESKSIEEKKVEGLSLEVPPESNKAETTTTAPKTDHVVRPWEQFCPDCGTDNPEFKDETQCSNGSCGKSLGAAKYLPKITKCPFCGSTAPAKLKSNINPKAIDLQGVKVVQ